MSKINYHNRYFRSVSNSGSGEVDGDTIFHYQQQGDIVSATYQGGAIRFGTLIAKVAADGSLDMRYHHVNQEGDLMTGKCHSVPEVLSDGRLRMHETWQWSSGDRSSGKSQIEEIKEEGLK
ncbi:MAG: n-acetylglutamate synthase [Ardenticatenaceae bacterium]